MSEQQKVKESKVWSAVDCYRKMKFDEMAAYLDEVEILEPGRMKMRFLSTISPMFYEVVKFKENIPDSHGLHFVYAKTHVNLQNLVEDLGDVANNMGEKRSSTFKDLVDYLFQQKRIMPFTEKWDCMLKKAQAVVTYLESFDKNGQCVMDCYIRLFLSVVYNFTVVRNRLRPKENCENLPFIFACIEFCESKLFASDACLKDRYDIYEVAILYTSGSLSRAQLLGAPWFLKHLEILDKIEKKANDLGIPVCTNKSQLIRLRKEGIELYHGCTRRKCIAAVVFYYDACLYKGMVSILEAADQTTDAVEIRMNSAMTFSNDFSLCVEQINRMSLNATSLTHLVSIAELILKKASNDHSKILKQLHQSSDNHLLNWVDTLPILDVTTPAYSGHLNYFNFNAWQKTKRQSLSAAEYILSLSDSGRCISQAYLYLFMNLCINFIEIRQYYIEGYFMVELQMILSVIRLCKRAFVTSNFSVSLKSRACHLANVMFTRLIDFNKHILEDLKDEVQEIKELGKEYNTELLKIAKMFKDRRKKNLPNTPQILPTTDTFPEHFDKPDPYRMPALSEDQFFQLIDDVSVWWNQYGNVNMIKVILCDFNDIAVAQIEQTNEPHGLFRLLIPNGFIDLSNIDVLLEAVILGGQNGLEPTIKQTIPSFPGLSKVEIHRISKHRRNVLKFGNAINIHNSYRIANLYNLNSREIKDQWCLIFQLERKCILTNDTKKSFIDKLMKNGMEKEAKALNTFQN